MQTEHSQTANEEYFILNKDVELCGRYFDVVPDGNLYTIDDMPIFAIRMRASGILYIMNFYEQKYGFHTDVLTYKLHSNQYTLYSDDTRQIYNTQQDAMLKYFDFSKCKDNEFRAIVIVVINEDDRLVHAIPYIYGLLNGRRKIVFLDPFYSPDLGSGCIIGSDFFYRAYNGEIDCYCHGELVQADHHSCGIIACDFIKNCLQHNYKVLKKIFKNVQMRTAIENNESSNISYVNIYTLPTELRRFAQIKHDEAVKASLADSNNQNEKAKRHKWFSNHIRTLIYRRDPEPYDPYGSVISPQEGNKKSINTSLLEKGHRYAGWITKNLKQDSEYNSKYWLSLIREQKEGNMIRRLLKRTRNIFKKSNQDLV